MDEFVVPPALSPGDEVAVVAPSSGAAARYPEVYELGLERIRERFGLEPVEFPTARKDDEYLREHPEERARDVMDAFADPDVDGVIATIGGNDQLRVLRHLDPDVLRENPTRFFGFSDCTNLALYLWNLGIVSFYGGAVMTEFAMQGSMHEYTVEHLERALFEESMGELEPAERFTDEVLAWGDPENLERRREMEQNPGWRWAGGDERAEGRLWGGCFEILEMNLVADRHVPDAAAFEGCVLALETSEELPAPERVWETLVGMGERGLLERFDAVLVGRPQTRTHRVEKSAAERREFRERQREVVADAIGLYNADAPVVFGMDFGHTHPVAPVPVGGRVVVDPDAETVRFA